MCISFEVIEEQASFYKYCYLENYQEILLPKNENSRFLAANVSAHATFTSHSSRKPARFSMYTQLDGISRNLQMPSSQRRVNGMLSAYYTYATQYQTYYERRANSDQRFLSFSSNNSS